MTDYDSPRHARPRTKLGAAIIRFFREITLKMFELTCPQ
jgi:hypothetical protein